MDKNIIKQIIIENQKEVADANLIDRKHVFEKEMNYAFVGMRRVGKSCLMMQNLQDRIKHGDISLQQCLYINFEDERIKQLEAKDLGIILDCHAELFGQMKPTICLDEIQNIDGWETFARRLADQKYRVFITGSNAKMLSREIATTLGGRFITRQVNPFAFSEYLDFLGNKPSKNWMLDRDEKNNIARLLDRYFHNGGLPETFRLNNSREWINSLYLKIILGDIAGRNAIRNNRTINLIVRKIADSLTTPVSNSRLRQIIKSAGENASPATIKDYLQYIDESYLTFAIDNYNNSLSERETTKKRYFSDNGILNTFLLQGETKLLENICAIKLAANFGTDYADNLFYFYNKVEVDFFIPSEKYAVQVAYDIDNEQTREREVKALAALHKAVGLERAEIVTYDTEKTIINGDLRIDVVPLAKWLL